MKALIQRVDKASVAVDGEIVGKIAQGLVVLVGVAAGDTENDIDYIVDKIVNIRIFSDADDKFNLSVANIKGDLLVISQFTLLADVRKGRRPSFIAAAPPNEAEYLFNLLVKRLYSSGLKINTGHFKKHMIIEIINNGPVTIMIDSKEKVI